MPFINVSVCGPALSGAQKRRIFDEITRLMSDVMKKDPDLTAVRIDQFPADGWAVGRMTVAEREETGVHVDIKITRGTNTEDEKAEMIRQGMSVLKDVLGATPKASYIVIHELDASTWGYDGETQRFRAEARRVAA